MGEVDRGDLERPRRRCTPTRRARSSSRAGTRARARPCGCARCRGSTAPGAGSWGPTGRSRRGRRRSRSFARARSSSRRAPPNAASKPCSAIASSSVTVCSRLREARGPVSSTTRPLSIDSCTLATISRSPSSADAAVAELDHLGEVVPGVHVHQRERERRRAERLLGQAQQHDRVLAAAEQQHRPLEFGGDLAHHVDRLGLERAQVAQLGAGGDAHQGSTTSTCRPHSVLSVPAQRPSRPLPGLGARRAADRLVALVVQRVVGQVALVDPPPQVLVGPVRRAGCTSTGRAARRVRSARVVARASAPARGGCPVIQPSAPLERALERGDLGDRAAVLGPAPRLVGAATRRRPRSRTPKRSSNARQVCSVSSNSTPVSIVTIRTARAGALIQAQQLVDQHRLLLLEGAQQHRAAGRGARPRAACA